eukprot:m.121666 g.121666  ORF g.121666 m.121666 type:complete len:147 (+) comp15527_c1_seq10:445-885(+)
MEGELIRFALLFVSTHQVEDEADISSLPLTKWKIPQPEDIEHRADALLTGGLDAIIVPGLAFSRMGGRLGRGKGYYDAFIRRCREASQHDGRRSPSLIAVGFDCQLLDDVPMESHDAVMDYVTTASSFFTTRDAGAASDEQNENQA